MTGTRADGYEIPVAVPVAARAEIARFMAQVPEGVSCLITGSLVEGIGNAHSDVDLYVIQPTGARTRPVAIGVRGARYVDCEYLGMEAIGKLADRIQDPSPDTLSTLSDRDFSRYYRLAIGIPLVTTPEAAKVLERCQRWQACARFADWSAVRAYEHLARAAVAHAFGRDHHARLLLREAALWRANHLLARAGEGYPSLKWTGVKASRCFGVDSSEYADCLTGYLNPLAVVAAELDRMRSLIGAPAAALEAMTRHPVQLGHDVTVVSDGDARYLLAGRRTISRSPGLMSRIVDELARGNPWPHAAERIALDLSLPASEVIAAAHVYMRALRDGGYLAPYPGA